MAKFNSNPGLADLFADKNPQLGGNLQITDKLIESNVLGGGSTADMGFSAGSFQLNFATVSAGSALTLETSQSTLGVSTPGGAGHVQVGSSYVELWSSNPSGIGQFRATGGDLAAISNKALLIPVGTTAQVPTGANGKIRYDTDLNKFRAYENGAWVDMISNGSVLETGTNSSGVLTGGLLSINGGDNTKFDISDGTGQIVDYWTTPGTVTVTPVSWSGLTAQTVTNLATNLITFVAINNAGAIVQQTTPFTNVQRRDLIILGVLVHVNLTNLDAVNNEQNISNNPGNQLYDMSEALGFFNVSGNVFSANGANLNLDKSVGELWKAGSNYDTDIQNPHVRTLAALVALTFQYRFQDGTNGATGIAVDPDIYDVGGTSTPVPVNKWTIQRIYSFTSNNVKIQPGQTVYDNQADAEAAIATESFVTEPSIAANGLLRGFLIVQEGSTDLSDTGQASFFQPSKFGEAIGGGGGAGGGTGDVVGPASSTDFALARYSGATGKLIQNSDIRWNNGDLVLGNVTNQSDIMTDLTTNKLNIRGGASSTDGSFVWLHGNGHATQSNIGHLGAGNTTALRWNALRPTLPNGTDFDQLGGTPANPDPGDVRLYAKNDGLLYSLDPAGTETLVSGGSGSGDVVGPGSSTDNAIARYDLATGKIIQNSGVTIDDTNNIDGVASEKFTEAAAPGTPAAGKVVIYAKTDGNMYQKDDTGTETSLVGGGSTPNLFDESYPVGAASATSAEQDNDYAVAWVPKQDMDVTKLYFWCTNTGTDSVWLGLYDDGGTKLVDGNITSFVLGPNSVTVTSQSVTAGTRYWLVLKTTNGAVGYVRNANANHVQIAKEKFDAADSLPADLSGFFVSVKAPWVGASNL